jgi:hypothetical protein
MISITRMVTTRPKESTKISRETMEREVKQTVTLNPKIAMINLIMTLMKLMTTKAVLMKAMKAIKASKTKIQPKTMIKIHLLNLQLNIELRMVGSQKKGAYSTYTLKKRKKTNRVKIQIKMMTTIKTALTMVEIVLQMTRMKMDLLLLQLAIPLPCDYYSIKN